MCRQAGCGGLGVRQAVALRGPRRAALAEAPEQWGQMAGRGQRQAQVRAQAVAEQQREEEEEQE
jgi:hypothetical protein